MSGRSVPTVAGASAANDGGGADSGTSGANAVSAGAATEFAACVPEVTVRGAAIPGPLAVRGADSGVTRSGVADAEAGGVTPVDEGARVSVLGVAGVTFGVDAGGVSRGGSMVGTGVVGAAYVGGATPARDPSGTAIDCDGLN